MTEVIRGGGRELPGADPAFVAPLDTFDVHGARGTVAQASRL